MSEEGAREGRWIASDGSEIIGLDVPPSWIGEFVARMVALVDGSALIEIWDPKGRSWVRRPSSLGIGPASFFEAAALTSAEMESLGIPPFEGGDSA